MADTGLEQCLLLCHLPLSQGWQVKDISLMFPEVQKTFLTLPFVAEVSKRWLQAISASVFVQKAKQINY